MTELLVSVRDGREARLAVDAGAAIIDVKEPARGGLGRAEACVWRDVLRAVNGRAPCSAALGELLDEGPTLEFDHLAGFQFAKLGLSGCGHLDDWQNRWRERLRQLPTGVSPVAVVYADRESAESPTADAIIDAAARCGCSAVLFDTFSKAAGNLFSHLPPPRLQRLISRIHECRMKVVLAGSLSLEILDESLALVPDFLAVRGAVCRPTRVGTLDGELVVQWVEAIRRRENSPPVTAGNTAAEQFSQLA